VCVYVCVCVVFQNLIFIFFFKSLFKNYAGLPTVFYVIQTLKEFQRSLHTTPRLHWTRNTQSSQRNRNAQEQSRYRTDITTVWLLEELGEHEVRSLLTSHLLHCAIYIHLYVYICIYIYILRCDMHCSIQCANSMRNSRCSM